MSKVINIKLQIFLCLILITSCASDSISSPPSELKSIKTQKAELKIQEYTNLFQSSLRRFTKGHLSFSDDYIYKLTIDGSLYIIRLDDLKIIHKKKYDINTASGVTQSNTHIYFGDLKGYLYSINKKTLDIKWKIYLGREITSTPLYYDNKVIVRLAEDQILAIDTEKSSTLWIYRYDSPNLTLRGNSNLIIINNLVYAALANGELVALNIDTGETIHKINFTIQERLKFGIDNIIDINADITERNGILFISGFNTKLKAIQGNLAREIWEVNFNGYTKPIDDLNNIYVSNANDEIYSFSKTSGQKNWVNTELKYRKLSAVNEIADYVVVGDYAGYLHLLDKVTGQIVARERLGTERILPIIYKIKYKNIDYLIVSDALGFLYKIHLNS